jgi:RNA polymerase sigma factor (sigma-70 family)
MIHKDKSIDSWLVLQTRAGNKKALRLLVKRWYKKLYKQACWYTKDMDVAKDIVQDCWTIIIKKIDGLKDNASFGSWALSIVTRKSIDSLRKEQREFNNLERYYDSNSRTHHNTNFDDSSENLIGKLRASIKELPVQNQVVLHLFYLEELSIRQISDVLILPEGTVKSRLYNAREKL